MVYKSLKNPIWFCFFGDGYPSNSFGYREYFCQKIFGFHFNHIGFYYHQHFTANLIRIFIYRLGILFDYVSFFTMAIVFLYRY